MRNRNLALILSYLHQNSPISRAELSSQLGINKASISTTVRELIMQGIVIEIGMKTGVQEVGHPSIDLMINPDSGRVIAIDLGSDRITAVVTDVAPNILWRKEVSIKGAVDIIEILSITQKIIDESCTIARSYNLPILGLGLSLPGILDIESNTLLAAFELGWRDVNLNPLMLGNEDIHLYTGNVAHMGAQGESYFGAPLNTCSALYINWGLEVSGGIIINENVVPGGLGLAGEIGHFSIDPHGELCACGNRGCWNTFANEESIFERIKTDIENGKTSRIQELTKGQIEKISMRLVMQSAFQGDSVALEALNVAGKWLGVGIANYINILNPELIVIGGPISQAYNFVISSIEEEINQRALPWQRKGCHIKPAHFRQDASLIGAVATVIWNMFNNPVERIKKANHS
jgi:predicted NBD/HSP70 family sugar kinase/biotin operon repressor